MSRKVVACLVLGIFVLISASASLAEAPLRVCLVSGSEEYDSDTSLTAFKPWLEERYNAECVLIKAIGFGSLPGLEALEECDVALFFTRRLTIDGEDLLRVKDYAESGKPIVAIRTASHGFQNYPEFDRDVLGGNYNGHFGDGPTQKAVVLPGAQDHAVMKGVSMMKSRYSLYRTGPLAPDATVLMTASTPGRPAQPLTWTRLRNGGRVFYTAMGGVWDFENNTFKRMVANALFWTARREVPEPKRIEPEPRPKGEGTLTVPLRSRVRPFKGNDAWEAFHFTRDFEAAKTAAIICDMWDKHWCDGATGRVDEIANKMDPLVRALRERGVLIVHAPSETMDFYAGSPQTLRIHTAPPAELPDPIEIFEPPLPIDDSDGGCDTGQEPWYMAWTRQHPAISIGPFDGISDDGDAIYNYLRHRGIENLFVMGVHANMCVLNRSFAIRRMTRLGMNCVLVRDLTDAMYNPERPPFVSHRRGTELVIEHIEKYWCPSATGEDIMNSMDSTPE